MKLILFLLSLVVYQTIVQSVATSNQHQIQANIYCSGCEAPKCIPAHWDYDKRRARGRARRASLGRAVAPGLGEPRCNMLPPVKQHAKYKNLSDPQDSNKLLYVPCTPINLVCECRNWVAELGDWQCAPLHSSYAPDKRRRMSLKAKRERFLKERRRRSKRQEDVDPPNPEADVSEHRLVTVQMCEIAKSDYYYVYLRWRCMCYETHNCSYPQPALPGSKQWVLFYIPDQLVAPGRVGTSGKFHNLERHVVNLQDACANLRSPKYPGQQLYDYKLDSLQYPDPYESDPAYNVRATLMCSGCDSSTKCVDVDKKKNCSFITNDPYKAQPKVAYVQPEVSADCQKRRLRCICNNFDRVNKKCLAPVHEPRDPVRRRQKQQRRAKRSYSFDEKYIEIGKINMNTLPQYLTHNVCVIDSIQKVRDWSSKCFAQNCYYIQPNLRDAKAERLPFYFEGNILTGFFHAEQGHQYRKVEDHMITEMEFCASIGARNYYRATDYGLEHFGREDARKRAKVMRRQQKSRQSRRQ